MNILLLNTSEQGGAGVASKRLFRALRKLKAAEIEMLVENKQFPEEGIHALNHSFFSRLFNQFRFLWERLVIWIWNGFSRTYLFAVSIANTGNDISARKEIRKADIIHLHWVNLGLLSLKDIHKLQQLEKPMVWTLHDMWPFTGICHYAGECRKFQKECGRCPYLKCSGKKDLSYQVFKKKQNINFSDITFVACSRWLKEIACKSKLLENSRVVSIPNPIDIALFRPLDKKEMKQRFRFNEAKHILLFGAMNISDPRKGVNYFLEALSLLADFYPEWKANTEIVFMGKKNTGLEDHLPFPAYWVGYLHQPEDIVALYNAVDLFVIPSLEDNLPNTVMESLSCGTPVVGFRTGGIPEMVDHKVNGYIANYKDSKDLMLGIHWALDDADYSELSRQARQKVENEYAEEKVAEKYLNLYRSLCIENPNG